MSCRRKSRPGGRPGASHRVRVVPVRRSDGLDHQALARILLAMINHRLAGQQSEAAATDRDDADGDGIEVLGRGAEAGRTGQEERS